jgi:KaiC/GvpD/RAD55 family RecA-like ATPase
MSQDARQLYEFDSVPIEGVRPGTSLLVAGPSLAGTRELALRMLVAGERRRDGLLLLAADEGGVEMLTDYEAAGGSFDRQRMAVIECSGPPGDTDDENIRTVASPSDLTGIGIEYSSLYEDLYAEGVDRARTGLFSISTLLMYADRVQPVFRFLHTLTGRVRSADGIAVCVADPSSHDEQTIRSISQTFDGRVDLRERDGETEIRVRGLPDQSGEWTGFDPF